ncbi:MAG: MFS transporter [Spirochaetota bacterium]
MQGGIAVHIRRLVLPVYLPMVLLSVGMTAPVAAFPQYLASLGASVAVVGVVLSMRGVGNVVSDLPGGLILGRVRLRIVVQIALLLASAASTVMALVPSVAVIGGLVLLMGTASSVMVTGMMTYVRISVPADLRGRALSLSGGSIRVGALLGPLAGGVLADTFGVPAAIGLRAAAFFAAFVVFTMSPDRGIGAPGRTRARSREPGQKRAPAGGLGLGAQFRAIGTGLRGRGWALATVGFAILMLQLLRASRNIVLPLWGDELELSATLIGSVMSAGAALELALFIPAGIIMDRAGRKAAAGLCIGIFSLGVFALSLAGSVPLFVFASLLIGLGNGFGSGINMTIGTDLAPSSAVSEFLGLWRLFGDVGVSAGPAIVGSIASAGGLPVAIVATALFGASGLVALLFAPETLKLARSVDEGG